MAAEMTQRGACVDSTIQSGKPVVTTSTWNISTTQHGDFVAQHQQLGDHRRTAAGSPR
jgi:hypothetical protein